MVNIERERGKKRGRGDGSRMEAGHRPSVASVGGGAYTMTRTHVTLANQ